MTDNKDDDKIVPFTQKPKDANDLWLGTEEEKKKLLDSITNAEPVTYNISLFPGREQEEAAVPRLKEMNEKYAFIKSLGGKPKVMEYMYNDVEGKDTIQFIEPNDLITRHCNETMTGPKGSEVILLGKWWLSQTWRNEYETVTFEPNKNPGGYEVTLNNGEVKRYFNMWEGFGVEPIHYGWPLTIRHIWKILCNKDKEKFKYVMRWMAWAVQNPGTRAEVALVFKGRKGAGKGIILTSLKRIFGTHGITISNRDHLTGKFNQHLDNKTFLFSDEAYHPGDKEVEGILKQIITEPYFTVEGKFQNARQARNCLHIVFASNEDWVMPITADERRYFVNEVDNMYCKNGVNYIKSKKYFKELWDELDNGGIESMLYYLQRMDIRGWHPRNDIPETSELLKQTYISLRKPEKAILELIEEGIFPGERDSTGRYTIQSSKLVKYVQEMDVAYNKVGSRQIKEMMDKLKVIQERNEQFKYYVFPKLSTLKSNWNRTICKVDWKDDFDWEVKTEIY